VLEGRILDEHDEQESADANKKIKAAYEAAKDQDKFKPPEDLTFAAIINHTMAHTFWPKQDALGREFQFAGGVKVRVIGIVGDVKQVAITEKAMPEAYFPISQLLGWGGSGLRLVAKTTVPPTSVIEAIRSELRESDSGLALFRPRTMEQLIADNMQDASLRTLLLGIFSGLALVLAAIGLYGVMAYLVTQRTHEIGIRMALGAEPGNVRGMILRQGTKLTLLGVGIGTVAALGLTRLMAKMLFGVSAHDPATMIGVAVLLILVAMLACYIPARRATKVDPMVALRYE
jgi:predicted permease